MMEHNKMVKRYKYEIVKVNDNDGWDLGGSFMCISHSPDHIFFDATNLIPFEMWESIQGLHGKLVFIPEDENK
jgi:hypothetical protein